MAPYESSSSAATGTADRQASPAIVREVYALHAYRAAVGAESPEARAFLRRVLCEFGPVNAAAETGLRRFDVIATPVGWSVRVDEAVVDEAGEFVKAVGMLESHLLAAALEHDDDLFHIHGAALSVPIRRAGIVLSGYSNNGKTTLTLGLMLRGFVPFSDDIALIEPGGLMLRLLRRAFHVDAETWPLLESLAGGPVGPDPEAPPGYFVPPQWAERPVTVRWVVFPEYRAGAPSELVRLSPSDAAAAILAQSASLARTPKLALATTARLVERAWCGRLVTSDLAAAVELLRRLVAGVPPA